MPPHKGMRSLDHVQLLMHPLLCCAGNIRTSFHYGMITAHCVTWQYRDDPTHNFPGKFTRSMREMLQLWKTVFQQNTEQQESFGTLQPHLWHNTDMGVTPPPLHIFLVSNQVNYWPLLMSEQCVLLLDACTTPCWERLKAKRKGVGKDKT